MRFNVGNIVRIAKSSEWYDSARLWNPKDMDGTITSISDAGTFGTSIGVDWENDENNYYRESDLKLRSRE